MNAYTRKFYIFYIYFSTAYKKKLFFLRKVYVNRRRAAKKKKRSTISHNLLSTRASLKIVWPHAACCYYYFAIVHVFFWRCIWMDSPDKVDDDTQPYIYALHCKTIPVSLSSSSTSFPFFNDAVVFVIHDHNYFFCAIHMMNNNKPLYKWLVTYDCIFYGFENICFSRLLLLSSSSSSFYFYFCSS